MTSTGTKSKRASAAKREPQAASWQGKAPDQGAKRGQWKRESEGKADEKIGFAVVSVELRPAEKAEFQALCKELGVTPNRAMRSLVRQAAGFLEVDGAALTELKSITRQISGVATNINQIAKRINAGGPAYQADMDEIRERLDEIWQLQRHILSNQR